MALSLPIISDDGSDEMDEVGNDNNGQNSGQLDHDDIANSLDEDKENQSHEGKFEFLKGNFLIESKFIIFRSTQIDSKHMCENEKVKVLV